jgi:hypothetical protein
LSDTRTQLYNGLNNLSSPTVTTGIIIKDKENEEREKEV